MLITVTDKIIQQLAVMMNIRSKRTSFGLIVISNNIRHHSCPVNACSLFDVMLVREFDRLLTVMPECIACKPTFWAFCLSVKSFFELHVK